jgi:hypothetical protein
MIDPEITTRSDAARETSRLLSRGDTDGTEETEPHNNLGEQSRRHYPPTSLCYKVFIFIGVVAILVAALMVVVQITSLAVLDGFVIQYILRCYLIVLSVMFILAEIPVETFLTCAPVFKNWVHRGFLYTFVGVVGFEESYAILAQDDAHFQGDWEHWIALLLSITSVSMFCIGVIYMNMGLCCMNRLWDILQDDYQEQLQQSDVLHNVDLNIA